MLSILKARRSYYWERFREQHLATVRVATIFVQQHGELSLFRARDVHRFQDSGVEVPFERNSKRVARKKTRNIARVTVPIEIALSIRSCTLFHRAFLSAGVSTKIVSLENERPRWQGFQLRENRPRTLTRSRNIFWNNFNEFS